MASRSSFHWVKSGEEKTAEVRREDETYRELYQWQAREEEFISQNLKIVPGETKTFANRNLHLSARIECEGKLEFFNCAIYYNEFGAGPQIEMGGDLSSLLISESEVICCGIVKEYFISGCSGSIVFHSVQFEDCSGFLGCSVFGELLVKQCEMKNCFSDFMNIQVHYGMPCEFKDNRIRMEELSAFNRMLLSMPEYNMRGPLISMNVGHGVVPFIRFQNNHIEEAADFRNLLGKGGEDDPDFIYLFEVDHMVVSNCTFRGITGRIEASYFEKCQFTDCENVVNVRVSSISDQLSKITECVFENCTKVIHTDRNTVIQNCRFSSCFNGIIIADGRDGGVIVEDCQFSDIKNFEEFETIGRHLKGVCLSFARDRGSSTKLNQVRRCTFDGIELNKGFLVAAVSFADKPWDTVTEIQNCRFKNCTTGRESGKIIKEYLQYYPVFGKKKKDFHANVISGCSGLNQ